MNILITATEMFPLIKTGGLGDSVYYLVKYLSKQNINTTIVLPYYKKLIDNSDIKKTDMTLNISIGEEQKECSIYEYSLTSKCCNSKVYLIYNEQYFNRDKIYSEKTNQYSDNDERWILFSKAVLELIVKLNKKFDIIHTNDWQTALIPALAKIKYKNNDLIGDSKHVFTVHNLAYQGLFPPNTMDKIGIEWDYFNSGAFEFWGHVNFIKGGLIFADKLTTFSKTYLERIKTSEHGYGLNGLICYRENDFITIDQGIDNEIWNPKTDKYLATNYSIDNLEDKELNKHFLQKNYGLEVTSDKPLIGIISRLSEQKGTDLIIDLLENIDIFDIQVILLGKGEEHYENRLFQIKKDNNRKLSINILFSEELAHQIEGGTDFFLIPSQFEAVATNQLYSMKYGSIPIVSKDSGLSYLINDIDSQSNQANGIVFDNNNLTSLEKAINKAIQLYKDKEKYLEIAKNSMNMDISWEKSINQFIKLYENLIK